MNLYQKDLMLTFLITLLLTIFTPIFSSLPLLLYFSPFLVICFYQKSLPETLWIAIGCGVILDLISNDVQMGLYSLNFVLVTLILYPQQKYFFADSLSTLPLMTIFFSSLSGFLQIFLFYGFSRPFSLSLKWIMTDLIFLPSLDGCFAFCIFILPAILLGKRPRRGKDYFAGPGTA